jgi:diketogulonate reductase-like aldo/keto reductase
VTGTPDITLNDGQRIPRLGFGVFLIKPEDTVAVAGTALEAGYRHVDTAGMYGNEGEVGEAIRKSGLDRTEVFVTSKLSNAAHRPDDARRAFDESLKKLGFDCLDLFLIHWRGDIVFPKSVTPDRIGENIEVFDFGRSAGELEAISALNRNERTGPDPDTFDVI